MLRWHWAVSSAVWGALCWASPVRAEPAPAASPARAEEWTPDVEAARSPHHLRSFAELGAGLGLGLGGYWVFKNDNVTDWDNPQLGRRFDGSAWVLDNNGIGVNFLGHPAWSSLTYSFARANHQSVAGAFGYSFLFSFIWEFAIEFKEKVSVNDVMVTPGTAVPIGEFFYKLGLYLDTGHQQSAGVQTLRWLLGTGVALDRTLDGRAAPVVTSFDNLGFSRQIWHEFSVDYGATAVTTPNVSSYARFAGKLSGRLVTLRGYGWPISFGRGFWGAEVSDFAFASEASRYGAGLLIDADTILAGYHAQAIERRGHVDRGASVTLGTSVGYEYLRSSANRYATFEQAIALPQPDLHSHTPTDREQFAAFDLPGLAVDMRGLGGWGSFDLSTRMEPSFGGLGAAAFYDWTAANPEAQSKHVLHKHGYFYGWGGSLRVRARLALGPLRAGFDLKYANYQSQDGMDRFQDRVTDDVHASGEVLRCSGSLGISPPNSPVAVKLDLGVRQFRSRVGEFERTARAVERGVSATWTF
jgi:Domain of unknown function (DUF3943)